MAANQTLRQVLDQAKADLRAHEEQEGPGNPADYRTARGSWRDVSDLILDIELAIPLPPPLVTFEDTGPALEAIAVEQFGAEAWGTLGMADKARYKQGILDAFLPGIRVLLSSVNDQLR